jgi:3-oxoacyl-(acyl-carrier-protein) synthase
VIWANAAGYRVADVAEERAIKRVFGASSAGSIVSPKKYLGESGGAGAIFNTALALTAWQNRDTASGQGQALSLRVRESPRVRESLRVHESLRASETALVNSCSLGGTHFSILLADVESETKEEE